MFKSENIFIRLIEPKDATTVMIWENNPEHWRVSDTEIPFSMQDILYLIDQAHHIRTTGQVRFVICLNDTEEPIGLIDLFDANFKHGRAGVGILIAEKAFRSKGFALESLTLLKEYVAKVLGFYSLYATMHADNESSIHLFEKSNFELVGKRKGWYLGQGNRVDELMFQICLEN